MSSTETARVPRVRHAQGGRRDGEGGIDPSHLGRTGYSRALSAALGSPAVSHPPWPPLTSATASGGHCLVPWLKDTGVGLECVCVWRLRLPLSAGRAVGEKAEEEKVPATPGGMSWRLQAPDCLLEWPRDIFIRELHHGSWSTCMCRRVRAWLTRLFLWSVGTCGTCV